MNDQEYQPRDYRYKFNAKRFSGFLVTHLETDLWIGTDPDSFQKQMKETVHAQIKTLRKKLDSYILTEPEFAKSLIPCRPGQQAPPEAVEMARMAEKAGVGPMASVAGLFSREAGRSILQNFSVKELVIENGGDIFVRLNHELVLSVYAGSSPLSEKLGIVIPAGAGELGICTSAGTIGPSLSFGRADAVTVISKDVLLADALATALGNEVRSPDDIQKVLDQSGKFPEILSLVIICGDKVGVRGKFEIKLLK
jgi:uncharacterized protein